MKTALISALSFAIGLAAVLPAAASTGTAAAIVKADIMTTNGVIHVIDVVLSPAGKKKPKKAK